MPEIDERTEMGISLAAEMLGEQFGNQVRDFVRSGQFGADLARIGLSNGLTVREIEEIMIHLSSYVGFPVMSSASSAITEVLRERGLIGGAKTSEERGLT